MVSKGLEMGSGAEFSILTAGMNCSLLESSEFGLQLFDFLFLGLNLLIIPLELLIFGLNLFILVLNLLILGFDCVQQLNNGDSFNCVEVLEHGRKLTLELRNVAARLLDDLPLVFPDEDLVKHHSLLTVFAKTACEVNRQSCF